MDVTVSSPGCVEVVPIFSYIVYSVIYKMTDVFCLVKRSPCDETVRDMTENASLFWVFVD